MRSVNFERSTSVLSMTPPGLAIRAAILIPSTALGKDEYWKLPLRPSDLSSKAGSAAPRISPRAHSAIESSPEADRLRKSRV